MHKITEGTLTAKGIKHPFCITVSNYGTLRCHIDKWLAPLGFEYESSGPAPLLDFFKKHALCVPEETLTLLSRLSNAGYTIFNQVQVTTASLKTLYALIAKADTDLQQPLRELLCAKKEIDC